MTLPTAVALRVAISSLPCTCPLKLMMCLCVGLLLAAALLCAVPRWRQVSRRLALHPGCVCSSWASRLLARVGS
jgi:hypothetical protein